MVFEISDRYEKEKNWTQTLRLLIHFSLLETLKTPYHPK